MSDKASELFWDVFTNSGHICIDCGCGRVHFSRQPSAGSWEEGELEDLLKKEEENPDRYIGTNDDSVSVAPIQGVPLCYGCPCGQAARYEKFILQHEDEIIDYYKRKSTMASEEAQRLAGNLSGLVK